MRDAAEAARERSRHIAGLRHDDGSAPNAAAIFHTIADDDAERAQASQRAVEGMNALYAALDADQRKQFDRRIAQAIRDPLAAG